MRSSSSRRMAWLWEAVCLMFWASSLWRHLRAWLLMWKRNHCYGCGTVDDISVIWPDGPNKLHGFLQYQFPNCHGKRTKQCSSCLDALVIRKCCLPKLTAISSMTPHIHPMLWEAFRVCYKDCILVCSWLNTQTKHLTNDWTELSWLW